MRVTMHELMSIALNIFSTRGEKDEWIESEIFNIEKGIPFLRGVTKKDGCHFVLTGDDKGIERCVQDREIFEYFEERVKSKIDEVGKTGFIERLNKYLAWVGEKAEKEGKDPVKAKEEAEEEIKEIKWINRKYFAEEET